MGSLPLKRLNKRAIKIADSLEYGDSSVWYYRIDATGAYWLSMENKSRLMSMGTMRSEEVHRYEYWYF